MKSGRIAVRAEEQPQAFKVHRRAAALGGSRLPVAKAYAGLKPR